MYVCMHTGVLEVDFYRADAIADLDDDAAAALALRAAAAALELPARCLVNLPFQMHMCAICICL